MSIRAAQCSARAAEYGIRTKDNPSDIIWDGPLCPYTQYKLTGLGNLLEDSLNCFFTGFPISINFHFSIYVFLFLFFVFFIFLLFFCVLFFLSIQNFKNFKLFFRFLNFCSRISNFVLFSKIILIFQKPFCIFEFCSSFKKIIKL